MATKMVYQWKNFSVEEQEHVLPNKKEITFTTIRHPGAVVIIPINSQGKITLLNQYRPAIAQWILEFPAGTIEPNEDIIRCAKRELAEEAHLKAENWQPLGELFPAPGFCDGIQYVFIATELSPTFGYRDEDEIIDILTLSIEEVEQKITRNEIKDNKTLASFLKARIAGMI